MTGISEDFQRARRPEQVKARRTAILDAASAMLLERPVADISLRELSDRVGLAKSNVLRYFDSREAIFLEVLDTTWRAWLDKLEITLRGETGHAGHVPYAREIRVATAIATSLASQPLLCELVSAMASVLERNISVEFARGFKQRATENSKRLARLVRAEVPQLDETAAEHYAGAVFVIVAGLWPYATPTAAIATVMTERGSPPSTAMFATNLAEGLSNQLVGLIARGAAGN